MKPIIIRKPSFMRNDIAMKTYIKVADIISKEACKPDVSPEERVEFLRQCGECLNKAAEAGGFLNTGDRYKCLAHHNMHSSSLCQK